MNFLKYAMLGASALLISVATSGQASTTRLCDGFLPQNEMKIPVGDTSRVGFTGGSGVTEAEYNIVMDRITKMYTDVVKAKGATLVVNRLWSDATVNASAEQQGNRWLINMYGGIARHPDTTFEGEALIACHEMGHHLGGAPKVSGFGNAWATNEGGADYFASLKCLRTLFAEDDNAAIIATKQIDPLAKSQCMAQFQDAADQDICMRISLAGESVAYIFQDLSKDKVRPQLSTPDLSKVNKTNDAHPATQCRMDTYFGGSLCPVAVSVPNSDSDFKAGSCVEGVDQIGFRSRCWFNPEPTQGGGGSCPLGDQSICDMICQLQPSLPFCNQ